MQREFALGDIYLPSLLIIFLVALVLNWGVSWAAAKFSRRWATDDVPGISSTLGERWSSQAKATCIGVAPRRLATFDNVEDCSGVKPPKGKNGT